MLPSGPHSYSVEAWNDPSTWKSSYGDLADGLTFFAMDVFGGGFAVDADGMVSFDPETGDRQRLGRDIEAWSQQILERYDYLTGHSLAHDWQVANGALEFGERLMPRQLFVLGGPFAVENLISIEAAESLRTRGVVATQIRDLPDGATVSFNPPPSP